MYKKPENPGFYSLEFIDINWPTNKEKNFFHILRDLTLRGPLSLTSLTHMYVDGKHPYDSVMQTLYRILNGSKHTGSVGMLQRELVVKEGKLFKLSPFGVLYAIHVFHFGKYQIKGHDKISKPVDYSNQKNMKGIFDVIKRNYNYFPLIFENLEYIKASSDLDINHLFDILDHGEMLDSDFYNFYKHNVIMDYNSALNNLIPFVFYFNNINHYFAVNHKAPNIDHDLSLQIQGIHKEILHKMKSNYDHYSFMYDLVCEKSTKK